MLGGGGGGANFGLLGENEEVGVGVVGVIWVGCGEDDWKSLDLGEVLLE